MAEESSLTRCMSKKRATIVNQAKTLTDLKSLKLYKKKELCNILSQRCGNQGGFSNEYNSCYLDSVLLALFHFPNNAFMKALTEAHFVLSADDNIGRTIATQIIKTLVNLYNRVSMGGVAMCTRLRELFSKYDRYYSTKFAIEHLEWRSEQLEPIDVIMFFDRLVALPLSVEVETKVYGTNIKRKYLKKADLQFIRTSISHTSPSSFLIDASELYGKSTILLKSYVPRTVHHQIFSSANEWKPINKQPGFLHRIGHVTYLSAPYMFIHIARHIGHEKLRTFIDVPEKVKLKKNKRNLYLQSIIVHHGGVHGGHYTCCIKCLKSWYYYDDLKFTGELVKIGDFNDLVRFNNGMVFKNCTDLIYA